MEITPSGFQVLPVAFWVFPNLIKPARPAVLSWAVLTGEATVAKLSSSALCWLHGEQTSVLKAGGRLYSVFHLKVLSMSSALSLMRE